MTLAQELRNARVARGLKMAQVAELVGLSISYISDLERGRTQPSLKVLRRLESFYGLPETSFVDIRDPERYVTIPRKDWERMTALVAEMQAFIGRYEGEGQR